MDAFNEVKQDLTSFVRTWTKTGIIVNPQIGGDFFSDQESISSKYCFFKDEEEYISNFAKAYENGQYLCALPDGSFFQIKYEFVRKTKNKRYIVKANLAYLPSVNDGIYNNEYVRIDYDVDSQSFFHPAAHLHVGFKGTFRLASNELLCFSEFFKFIMYLYYPKVFLKLIGKENIKNSLYEYEGKYTKNIPISKELNDFVHITMSNLH